MHEQKAETGISFENWRAELDKSTADINFVFSNSPRFSANENSNDWGVCSWASAQISSLELSPLPEKIVTDANESLRKKKPIKNNSECFDKVNIHRKKYQKSCCFPRWGRKDDIIAYRTLHDYLNKNHLSLETFFNEWNPEYEEILNTIISNQKWMRTPEVLYSRLYKWFKETKSFSVRYIRKLKRLTKKWIKVDGAQLLNLQSQFPGSTIETLKKELKKLGK